MQIPRSTKLTTMNIIFVLVPTVYYIHLIKYINVILFVNVIEQNNNIHIVIYLLLNKIELTR